MRHFFFSVQADPTTVNRMANMLRLHFANCEVLAGTERAWVHVFADTQQDVERRFAGLPSWFKRSQIREW